MDVAMSTAVVWFRELDIKHAAGCLTPLVQRKTSKNSLESIRVGHCFKLLSHRLVSRSTTFPLLSKCNV